MSKIDIANVAILELGANPIANFQEQSTAAKITNATYDINRRQLLRSYPFKFAKKQQELARAATDPLTKFKYKYKLPTNCIRVISPVGEIDYKIEGRFISSDAKKISLLYIADIENENEFDSMFTTLLIAKMKISLSYAITKDNKQLQLAEQAFGQLFFQTIGIDQTEDPDTPIGEYDHNLITSRYGN